MASHYVSITRGKEGLKTSELTVGAASAAADLFEFRILDGVTPKRIEVIKALEAFERYFSTAPTQTTDGWASAGFDIG